MTRQLPSLLLAVCLSGLTITANAGEDPQKKGLFVSPFAAHLGSLNDFDIPSDEAFGVGLGFGVSDRTALELSTANFADVNAHWLGALFSLAPPGRRFDPYVVAGLGLADISRRGIASQKEMQGFLGVGTFVDLSRRLSLRGDVRAVKTGDVDGIDPYAQVGLTLFLGAVAPNVPLDTDSDGVPDSQDNCPSTPAGRVVGANGCQLDGDGDGVTDADDRCPNSPRGAVVNSQGCTPDNDGDGIPDHRDECLDTEPGAKVDDVGCYIELEEVVTIDLALEFDLNSAELRPEHRSEIARVAKFLREYPTANAVIEGHTDSAGSDAYNQQPSERRAASVRDYLIQEAQIESQRLTSVGYGESRPISDNATSEGRQANRRVTASISGKHTVRQ